MIGSPCTCTYFHCVFVLLPHVELYTTLSPQVDEKTWDFTQRRTEEEIQTMKKKKQGQKDSITQKRLDKARLIEQKSQSNISLLAKIFNSKQSE